MRKENGKGGGVRNFPLNTSNSISSNLDKEEKKSWFFA